MQNPMSLERSDALAHIVDTARYPLHAPDSARWRTRVARTRRALRTRGCAVLTGFVRGERLDALRNECAALSPLAYDTATTVNAYNLDLDTPLPADHPAGIHMQRGNAFVAADCIAADALLRQLYASLAMRAFVAACMGLPEVHLLGDPLACLCVNVLRDGHEHPWHFDTNEFTVSLMVQASEAGGRFEFCPDIRSPRSENLDAVRDVLLRGEHARVRPRALQLQPGDLQIFRGRYSLHRVSRVVGSTPRLTAILAYAEHPGVVGSPARTRQLFGRTLPAHTATHARNDALLD